MREREVTLDIQDEQRLARLEKKIDFLLGKQIANQEENRATQRAIALLKADFKEIVTDSMKSVLHKRAVQGYSQIAGGK